MACCVLGRHEVEPDGAFGENESSIVERCFCEVGTKSEVAARRECYFFFLDAEFLED